MTDAIRTDAIRTDAIRVVQWATGSVGIAQLREVVDRPDLELVGLFVYDPTKVGVDAGALVGRAPTGIAATNDKAAILALDADVVLHAASKAFPQNTNTDDIVALLESGKNVITTTSYNHLPTFGADADARIRHACERAGTRFHAGGEHPGFMFERLATSLTALSQRVDTITVQEFVDCSGVSGKEMLVDLMGMGKRPEDITIESPMFRAVSVQYEQAIGAAADVLGLTLDEIRHSIETGTSPRDVEVACGTLPAGTVVGQIMSWTGYRDGAPVLVAQEYWTVTDDIPGWDLDLEQTFLVRVIVDGAPSLKLDLTIGNDAVGDLEGTSGGQLAVAMTAVRAIPDVLQSPPGVVVAPVFGAYHWPDATPETSRP
jgi:hypothetical protein